MSNKKLTTNALSHIMNNLKIKLLSILICFSLIVCAQSETQIANEINKLGISSMSDVNTELAKRGMSETEARKMAKVYGIDYDEYILKYVSRDEIPGANRLYDKDNANFDSLTVSKLDYKIPAETARDSLLDSDSTTTLHIFGSKFFITIHLQNKNTLLVN